MRVKQNIRRYILGIVFISLPLSGIQSEPQMDERSRAKAEKLRTIVNNIKACPRVAEWQDKGSGTIHDGPPSNVVWDAKPGSSIRAPFVGSIEFFLPREFDAPEKKCRKEPGYCAEMMNDTKPFRYRYEFDIGPDTFELTRMLVKAESDKRWRDARPDDSCWQKAARIQ